MKHNWDMYCLIGALILFVMFIFGLGWDASNCWSQDGSWIRPGLCIKAEARLKVR